MQPAHVWFLGHPPELGSARAKVLSWPGSRGTPKSAVFLQPGSLRPPASSRAWRFRARGDGAKILGLPPPFPPFTASISSLPPPPSLLLLVAPRLRRRCRGFASSRSKHTRSDFLAVIAI
ncbi:uncharacterized protein [Miscanthus floridulus]|uniref:uncharacterized protein n=1 Tax=Miscanthus floridulus TaxID=154761 RepID=UPI003458788D